MKAAYRTHTSFNVWNAHNHGRQRLSYVTRWVKRTGSWQMTPCSHHSYFWVFHRTLIALFKLEKSGRMVFSLVHPKALWICTVTFIFLPHVNESTIAEVYVVFLNTFLIRDFIIPPPSHTRWEPLHSGLYTELVYTALYKKKKKVLKGFFGNEGEKWDSEAQLK